MNISFFVSSVLSAYWNGAATYYRGLIKALHNRGHRITVYEPDAYHRQQHRDLEHPSWARVIVYANHEDTMLHSLEAARRQSDMIVKASGIGVFDELLEAAVLEMKEQQNYIVYCDVDAPATLERVEHNLDDPFRKLIPRYDFIFTYGGGSPVVRGYESFGAKLCVPIYYGQQTRRRITLSQAIRDLKPLLGFWGIDCRIARRVWNNSSSTQPSNCRTGNFCSAGSVGTASHCLRT